MSMPRWTLILGSLLVLVGVGFYLGTGRESPTALIPAFLGVPLLLSAAWAKRATAAAMHAAAVLALLGFAGTVAGVPKALRLAAGGAVERPEAAVAQTIVAAACLVYLVLAIRSFVRARRARATA